MEASVPNSELSATIALYDLVFIQETNSTPAFQAAYEKSVELELDPQLISTEFFNVSEVEVQDKIYIVSSFESELFASLRNLDCQIMGPVALLMAMQDGSRSIVRRPRPVFNLIMRPCVITFSSLSKEVKSDLLFKILKMGGQVYPKLIASTTHLITDTVGSEKYHVAVKNNIPIMLPSWIAAMAEDDSINPKMATDPEYERFRIPLFSGLTIAVSNIEGTLRKEMATFIKENGGNYSGVLQKNLVSHLILSVPSGAKFKAACEWGIKCVTPEWYNECIRQGNVVPEDPFLLGKSPTLKSSTPTKNKPIGESMFKMSLIDPITSVNTTTMSAQGDEDLTIYAVENMGGINVKLDDENHTSKSVDERLKIEDSNATRIPQDDNFQDDDITVVQHEDIPPETPTPKTSNDETLQPQPEDEDKENQLVAPGLFNDLTFDVQDFQSDVGDQIKELILKNGGVISKSPAYIIVPMNMFKKEIKFRRNCEYVTVWWLQLSMENEAILPVDENFVFRPLTIPDKVETEKPLRNCVITLSQFNSLIEQQALTDLIEFLGGVVQDSLTRRAQKSKGLLPNTHLILRQCEGKKYEAAQTWGIKTMKAEWLYFCATTGELVDEEKFYVRPNDPSKDAEVPTEKPWSTKRDERVPVQAAVASTSKETKPINGKPKPIMIEKSGPDWKPGRVKFDLTSRGIDMDNLDDSFDTKIQKNMRKMGKWGDNYPDDYFKPTKFQCVYLTTSKKLRKRQPELFEIAEDLRMNCFKEDTKDRRLSHIIHEQSLSEPLPHDVKFYLNSRKLMIVSPEWIYECQRQNKYLEPSLFPYHYKKNLSLAPHISSQKLESPIKECAQQNMTIDNGVSQCDNNASSSNAPQKNLEASLSNLNMSSPKAAAASSKSIPEPISVPSTQDVEKQLDMLLSATKAAKNIYEEKKNVTQLPVVEPRHRSFPRTETQPLDIDDLCPSQQAPIIWSDQPRDASGHTFTGMTTCNAEASMHIQKVFHLGTSHSDEELEELMEIIESLGAKALLEKQFDNTATHYVVEKLSKSERMLSCIAAGKTIIHKEYLKDSKTAGKFLDEDKYVIGSQAFIRDNDIEEPIATAMAAVYRWQQKFNRTGEGAYSDWCVFLKTSDKKSAIFRRVLEAGGATIVNSPNEMIESKKRMAFMEKPSANTEDIASLMAKQIWCLKPEYFSDYLHEYPEPDIEKYLFPGAEKFLSLIRSRPIKRQKVN